MLVADLALPLDLRRQLQELRHGDEPLGLHLQELGDRKTIFSVHFCFLRMARACQAKMYCAQNVDMLNKCRCVAVEKNVDMSMDPNQHSTFL